MGLNRAQWFEFPMRHIFQWTWKTSVLLAQSQIEECKHIVRFRPPLFPSLCLYASKTYERFLFVISNSVYALTDKTQSSRTIIQFAIDFLFLFDNMRLWPLWNALFNALKIRCDRYERFYWSISGTNHCLSFCFGIVKHILRQMNNCICKSADEALAIQTFSIETCAVFIFRSAHFFLIKSHFFATYKWKRLHKWIKMGKKYNSRDDKRNETHIFGISSFWSPSTFPKHKYCIIRETLTAIIMSLTLIISPIVRLFHFIELSNRFQ